MWKKLSETSDIISYEKKKRSFKVRIEARLNKNYWQIYKTYFNDNGVDFVEEYCVSSKKEAQKMIRILTRERDLTLNEIKGIKKLTRKKLDIKLKRDYKEYDVEKWFFSLGDDVKENFITIRFGEDIDIDVVIHEHYRFLERKIIDKLISILGLDKFDINMNQNVYFFNKKTHFKTKAKDKALVIGKIEMGFESD